MTEGRRSRKKITIVGTGNVGATTALWTALKELGDIVLYNRTLGLAAGRALDLKEASPLEGFDLAIVGTDAYEDTANSDVVVITAGIPRQPGMSREELLDKNAEIVTSISRPIAHYSPHAVLIVVTNPVDAMVHVAHRATGFPTHQVIGMAGILDSSRFRTFIGLELGVSVEDIHALVLGGHGDFMVPLPRHASVSGIPLTELLSQERITALIERTRHGGAEILGLQKVSSAFYAPAAAIEQMIEAVVRDKKRILPCVAYLQGEYGVKGIFMGVPVLLGGAGVERVVELSLTATELSALCSSADAVRTLVARLPS
jgi:malate dehydrogenase